MTVASSGSGLSSTGRPGIRFNSSGGAAAGATHSRLARIARALRTSAIRSLFVLSGRVALRYSGARIPANPGAARVVGGVRYKLRGRLAARVDGGDPDAQRRSRVPASAPDRPSVSPSRCAVNASSTVPAREDNPVPSATTSTVPKDVLLLTFKVNLLDGWIAGLVTAILPAQADVPALPHHPARSATGECGLVGYSNASAGRSKTRRIRSATTPSGRSATSITQPTRGSTAITPPSASSELREEERRRP